MISNQLVSLATPCMSRPSPCVMTPSSELKTNCFLTKAFDTIAYARTSEFITHLVNNLTFIIDIELPMGNERKCSIINNNGFMKR